MPKTAKAKIWPLKTLGVKPLITMQSKHKEQKEIKHYASTLAASVSIQKLSTSHMD
jgi:hypothetical protein